MRPYGVLERLGYAATFCAFVQFAQKGVTIWNTPLLLFFNNATIKYKNIKNAQKLINILSICLEKLQSPVFSQYAVSGQTQTGIVIHLRQHRMIHADCRASAVDYAALP